VSALLPVHLYGHPVDLDPLDVLAKRHGVVLVEDAAEALGARYKNRTIGAESRYCSLSFNGNKIITGGAGGMVLTDDPAVDRIVRHLANQAKAGDLQFEHDMVGFNYRMPNINAAILCAQAEMLAEFIQRKREIVARYRELLADIPGVRIFTEAPWATSSYWMAVLSLDENRTGNAQKLLQSLASSGIQARHVWMPLSKQAAYADAMAQPTPLAEELYRSAVCLPCSCGIKDSELIETAAAIRAFVRG
jgi:perosamine synthetase